ncbi:MAG: hypothetical protein JW768_07080 [Chitinispirillaceae bacterium]|nr:hypothetical protein [Chitinispirillaceae bacterium]
MSIVAAKTRQNTVCLIPAVIALAISMVFSADTLTAAHHVSDTATAVTVVDTADSLSAAAAVADTAPSLTVGSRTPLIDSLKKDTLPFPQPRKEGSENIKLIKRTYGGRQQVLLATGMMIFVVAIMTAAQQWNPR